ncbi:hypothetical protein C2845_PM07G10870 [Panicum miliaceum]|uniref:Uncharacterized protein n=1 Tax=Panicum miliaceum TaxID=4540 RepID=A0A3L6SJV2_PANMI|nr:hypothetical protein C2845_PM07G10870 [Panicum miliaceum]
MVVAVMEAAVDAAPWAATTTQWLNLQDCALTAPLIFHLAIDRAEQFPTLLST